jgi:hypothetical protein
LGIVTLGDAPNAPVAVTALLVASEPTLEVAGELEGEDEELEDPQPATAAAAASRETRKSAGARRIGNLTDLAWCSGRGSSAAASLLG